jgi:sulfur carrier protein
MRTITLEINGEIRTLPLVSNVVELLQELGISDKLVAIELNKKILRKGEWENTHLSDMDHVEIVQFVGGG